MDCGVGDITQESILLIYYFLMQMPKHIYIAGTVTGAVCGLVSALTAYTTIQYVAAQDLEKNNPVAMIVLVSIGVGILIGLVTSAIVHRVAGR